MNEALIKEHVTGGARRYRERNFPSPFTCNRDEWAKAQLAGDMSVELDCDLVPDALNISFSDFISSFFMPWFLVMVMWFSVTLLVYEKETGLRQVMKTMGLSNFAYWSVNYLFYFAQYMVVMIICRVFSGMLTNMRFYTLHSPAILWGFLIIWGNVSTALAMLLSVFFKSARTASAVSLLYIYLSIESGRILLTSLFFSEDYADESLYAVLMLFPPITMLRTVYWFTFSAGARARTGLTTENWSSIGHGVIPHCMNIMVAQWFVIMALLFYFENTLEAGSGVRLSRCFCVSRRYWARVCAYWRGAKDVRPKRGGAGGAQARADIDDARSRYLAATQPLLDAGALPSDVAAEHERVLRVDEVTVAVDDGDSGGGGEGGGEGGGGDMLARVVALHKTYPASGKAPEKTAVQMVSLGIGRETCFGLLGSNGAGKTTFINMLTGLFEPSSGTALVGGRSIAHDMGRIQQTMGVCPQHDHLWRDLTAREHLLFYGRLKGYAGAELKTMVDHALKAVNLDDDPEAHGSGGGGNTKKKRVKEFSGGMKRRLSVACSLMGNPRLVYMDEPSTGLDPASRRKLWELIVEGKKGRAIVLTTHSMEEADVLCDRIGVMSHGLMQCLGDAPSLKLRFGAGYALTVTTEDPSPEAAAAVADLVRSTFPAEGAVKALGSAINGQSKFELQRKHVKLSQVFKAMEGENRAKLGITDWGITETTLEEVFLHLVENPVATLDGKKKHGAAAVVPEKSGDAVGLAM